MDWQNAPVLTGSTHFEPLEDVRNIMITGGAGFIGSWLARHLTLTYPNAYRIISFDKIDYCASLKNTRLLDDKDNFLFCYGNVTDIKSVMRCIKDNNVDTIFHFAAQSHVDLSFGNSFEFTKTNVEGTHVMLESAVKLGVKRFIHISTDEVNGEIDSEEPDLLENSLLNPTNPYAASKAAAEMYVHAYSKSFKLPVIIIRSNNVYGPHQYPEKIIPKFACLLDRRKPLIIHGDGTHTRRYLFAGDAAEAFDTILHKGQLGEIYNVSSRDEISNLGLATKMLGHFGIAEAVATQWICYVKDRPFNDKRYAVDASKLRGLGWEQKTGFEEGLKLTVEWYRKFGTQWWGNIESMLTPFPEVPGEEVRYDGDPAKEATTLNFGGTNRRAALLVVPATTNAISKKRSREAGPGKENKEMIAERGPKRLLMGEGLSSWSGKEVEVSSE